MKLKRTDRLIDMAQYLVQHPNKLVSLSYFSEKYEAAKSSISEDLVLLKESFEKQAIGLVETVAGAAGGVRFVPTLAKDAARDYMLSLRDRLANPERILPGGYLYLSDLLSTPEIISELGKIIAVEYTDQKVDAVMTVATKGVPLAQAVATYLNVPFLIVRRDSKVTEGATISVNYASATATRVEKMELSKRSLKRGARVLIVDDFLKGGGTIAGMRSLVAEFEAHTVGVTVFAESGIHGKVDGLAYQSLLRIDELDVVNNCIEVSLGNYFEDSI